VVAAGILAVMVASTIGLGLNGDVQYNLGGLAVHAADEPTGWVRTFTHRPVAYRGIMAAILDGAALVGLHPSEAGFEAVVRMFGVALSAAAGLAVAVGLRRRLPCLEASAAGLAVTASLALAPNFDFLQAEWFAAGLTAAAVGVALGARRPWVGAGVAGSLLTMAVAVKLSTVVLAPAGVLLIALFDRRRAQMTAVVGVIAGVGWLGLSAAILSERQWLADMIQLDRDTLRSPGFNEEPMQRIVETVVAKLLVSPVAAALPAAIVLLAARRRGSSMRARIAVTLAAVWLLILVPPFLQVPSFVYHLAALPVLAAALLAIAVTRWVRLTASIPWPMLAPLLAYAILAATILVQPLEWREAARAMLVAIAVGGPVAALGGAWWVVRRPRSEARRSMVRHGTHAGVSAAVVLGLGLFLPTVLPDAGWASTSLQSPYTNASWIADVHRRAAEIDTLRRAVDDDAPVLYLAYGTAAYHLGNPTPCRYPSPLFVQRAALHPGMTALRSYRDNLRCLDSEVDAVILEPDWLRTRFLDREVRRDLAHRYDCSSARSSSYVVCLPR
jgi:hypothetical protein